jgi:UDP-N-acetylmuramate dehydrogenase
MAAAERRSWMKGLRSAGSVFRNPGDDSAGRLIEDAGLKGLRIGGAEISRRHANVIATSDDATASDVLALIQRVQDSILSHSGTRLGTEIVVWG